MVSKMLRWAPITSARTAPTVIFALVAIYLLVLGGCSQSEATSPSPSLYEPGFSSAETRPDGAIRLTTPPNGASDQNPAFSPDGTQLVFTRFENGYNQGPSSLYLLDLASGTISLLTSAPDSDNVNLPGSSWNAATSRITFSSDRQDADEVWTIAPDGSDLFRVTYHTTVGYFVEPSFSPDGQWIVFEFGTDVPGEPQQGSIWKIRADGAGLTQLTSGSTDDRQPNWSPTGDQVLFQRRSLPNGQWDIYTMTPDGSDLQSVTNSPIVDDTDASWSPGGTCIVYSSDNGDQPLPNIFAIPATGGRPIQVTFSEEHEDGAPSWAPDGKWVAFESHESEDEDSPSALWRVATPGGVCDKNLVYLAIISTTSPPSDLSVVNDFLYQLQDLDLAAVGNTAYDLVIVDYSADGSDETAYAAAQIAALKQSPGGDKIVLAYMSIGEAENYRFYWDDSWDADGDGQPDPGAPPWLDVENPDWEGNYKVHYWDADWQSIVLSYTGRLLNAGFDGVYLDIVDAYEYYAGQGRSTAAQEMADFVAAIRTYAHARDPDFYIFPQNAPELVGLIPAYLDSVDGIGQEDIYYGYEDDDTMTPPAVTAELEGYLDLFKSAAKLVLTTDYATSRAHVDDAYARSRARGYVPFVTVRDLNQLTINPGHEPD